MSCPCNYLHAALEGEAVSRAAADAQLVQQRRVLMQEVQQVRAAGEAALRQVQQHADTQQRQLEAELERAAARAAEQVAAAAAAHAADKQRAEVGAGRDWAVGAI